MDKHEAKKMAIWVRRNTKVGDYEFLSWIGLAMSIFSLVAMVFVIISGAAFWKIVLIPASVIAWSLMSASIMVIAFDEGVQKASEEAEKIARNISDYD